MRRKIALGITLMLVVSLCQLSLFARENWATQNDEMQTVNATADKDIVDTAASNPQLKTLTKALGAAGLTDTLKGQGPYTVFAPTDMAFSQLPAGTLDNLLKPENKDKLADILKYHVYPGKVTAAEATRLNGQEITMANGKKAKIEVRDGALYIDGAKVITADVMTKNGIVHIIDTVMLPE